jgi:serine/threonine-protein kinase RsbW
MRSEQHLPLPRAKTDTVEIVIPGQPEYVVIVRLAAAGIAGRMGFSYEDIEDLKLAVGEACTSAILAGSPQVRIRFNITADRLEIQVKSTPSRRRRPNEERALETLLIQVLMDEVEAKTRGPEHITRMIKQLQKGTNGGSSPTLKGS